MKDLTFKVTEQEANLLTGALGELPYKLVADLIIKLRVQAAPQLQEYRDETQETAELHSESNQEAGGTPRESGDTER